MKDRFLQQAKREYGPNQRSAALVVEAVFFIGILPLALLLLGGLLDRWLSWPKLMLPPVNVIIGTLHRDRLGIRDLVGLCPVHPGPGHTRAFDGDPKTAHLSPLRVLPQSNGPGCHRALPGRECSRRLAGSGAALAPRRGCAADLHPAGRGARDRRALRRRSTWHIVAGRRSSSRN